MKKIIYILAILMALPMVGCVTKRYKSPKASVEVDSLYRVLESAVDTSINTGAVSWREFFTDTVLRSHIDSLLLKNLDFSSAKLNVDKAYAQLRSARAAYAPTVGPLSVGGGVDLKSYAWSAQAGLGASWELDIWGKIGAGKRAAQAAMMASEDGVRALQTKLIAEFARGYYQLVIFDYERKIILETIENRSQYLDTIRLMKNSGKVNEIAVQQAVAQLGEVKVALPKMELAIIKTENALSMMLGKHSGGVKRVMEVDFTDSKIITELGVPSQLLRNRPDVRQAEQNYRNAFEMYNVSRAAMYPSLNISANALLAPLWSPHFATLEALASLTAPLWNGRKLRSQKEIADFGQQQAKFGFQIAVLNAGKEVSDALASQSKTVEIANAQKAQLEAYKKAYEYSFELFVNGYATYLDVLTAQTGVFNTQMNLLTTYFDNIAARIELYRALGGGSF